MALLGIDLVLPSRVNDGNDGDGGGGGEAGPSRDSDSTGADAGLDAAQLAQKLGQEAQEAGRAAMAAASVALRWASTPSSPTAAPAAAPAPTGTGPRFRHGWHFDQASLRSQALSGRVAALDLAHATLREQLLASPRGSHVCLGNPPLTSGADTDAVTMPRTARINTSAPINATPGPDALQTVQQDSGGAAGSVDSAADTMRQLDVADQQDTGSS